MAKQGTADDKNISDNNEESNMSDRNSQGNSDHHFKGGKQNTRIQKGGKGQLANKFKRVHLIDNHHNTKLIYEVFVEITKTNEEKKADTKAFTDIHS